MDTDDEKICLKLLNLFTYNISGISSLHLHFKAYLNIYNNI